MKSINNSSWIKRLKSKTSMNLLVSHPLSPCCLLQLHLAWEISAAWFHKGNKQKHPAKRPSGWSFSHPMLFKQDSQKVSRCGCCAQGTAWNDGGSSGSCLACCLSWASCRTRCQKIESSGNRSHWKSGRSDRLNCNGNKTWVVKLIEGTSFQMATMTVYIMARFWFEFEQK